jgi:glucose/arabinose dehydrogenase
MVFVALVASACSDDDEVEVASSVAPSTTTSPATTPTTVRSTTTTVRPDPASARVALVDFATGLDSPVDMVARPGTRVFYVAEQYTGVRAVGEDGAVGELVLDLRGAVSEGNEQGVLGLAFAPDGEHLYVDFTDPSGDTQVVEYAMVGDDVDEASAREILSVEQPFPNHNGGGLQFGLDGMLYIALGDGGAAGDPLDSGQDRSSLLAKILRIDPAPDGEAAYTIPDDNPFVGGTGAPEVWAWGLRNPWRFSFDRETGDLWIGDVGQNLYEEIDVAGPAEGGVNFGWRVREGFHAYTDDPTPADARDPVFELAHDDDNCSVTGGFVYRGAAIPLLAGGYVFADFCKGDLLALDTRGDPPNSGPLVAVDLGIDVSEVSSFGQDSDGELYVVERGGTIRKLVPAT